MSNSAEESAIASTFDLLHSYPEFANSLTLDVTIFQDLQDTIGDDLMFSELVTLYLDSAESLIESIQSSFANQDVKEFSIKSHSLKSTSASIGATRLSQISKHLEISGKKGELTACSEIVSLLNGEYAGVVTAIETLVLEFMPDYKKN